MASFSSDYQSKIFVRAKEASILTSLSERHLYNMMGAGLLPFIKSGKCRLIKVKDLENLQLSCTNQRGI